MAKSLTIKNKNNEILYPKTVSELVYNDNQGTTVKLVLNTKLDVLVSGDNIKTVNNNSILGSGNISIEGESAYQVATRNGFVGTEAQWLDSLKGPQGNTGNVTVSDGVALITIVNNLTDGGTGDALSAEMGKELGQDVEAMKYVLEMDGSDLNLVTLTLGYCTGSSSTSGSYSGGGNKLEGDSVTAIATPNSGYSFVGWYSDAAGTTLVSSNASYTFTINSNTTLYAKFEEEQESPTQYEAELTSINEEKNDGSNYGIIPSSNAIRTTTNPNWDTWVCELPSGYGAHIFAQSADAIGDNTGSSYYELRYGTTDTNPLTTLATASEAALTIEYADYGMLKHSHWVSAANSDRFLCVSGNANTYGSSLVVTLYKVDSEDSAVAFSGMINDTALWFTTSRPYIYKSTTSSTYKIKYHLLEAGKIGFLTADFTVKSKNTNKQFGVGYSNDDTIPYLDADNPYQVNVAAAGNLFNVTSSVKSGKYHFVFEPVNYDRYILVNCDYNTSGTVGWMSNVKLTKITPYTAPTPVLLNNYSSAPSLMLSGSNSNTVRSIRLDRIEANILNLSEAIENISPSGGGNTDVAELENTINNVDARVLTNTLRISALESAVEDLGGDVSGGGLESRDPYGLNLHCAATEGLMRFIKRARLLTDIKFTPAFNMRRVCGNWDGANLDDVFTSGKEYQGIPYTRIYNMYGLPYLAVGNCVSLDTFATACAKAGSWQNVFDPAATSSYIYSSVENNGTNVVGADMKACFYGTYCSGFWAYAYDVKYCYLTYVKDTAGFTQGDVVGTLTQSNLHNSLHLGDTMINYPNNVNRTAAVSHVVVITDVWYNSDGTIYAVEVSESTTSGRYDYTQKGLPYGGVCRRMMWPVDKFLENWEQYTIYHYSDFEHIDYTPSSVIPVGNEGRWFTDKRFLPLLPKSGNHFLYKKSFLTEKNLTNVVLMPTISGTVNVVNELAGTDVNYTCTAGTNLSVVGNEVGTYSACIKGSSSTSLKCYWRVSTATITKSVSSNTITFTVVCPDDIDIPWNVSFSSNSTASQAQVMNGKVRCTNGNRIIDTIPTVNGNTRTYVFSVSRPNSTYGCAWITFKTKEFGNWISDAITL